MYSEYKIFIIESILLKTDAFREQASELVPGKLQKALFFPIIKKCLLLYCRKEGTFLLNYLKH